MASYYFERAQRNVAWCRKYGALASQDTLLELGTGWVHWEALTLRLFYDFRAVLYDVWDNRQLRALKSYVRQLEQRFGFNGYLEGCDFDRARDLINKIEAVESFNELYSLLGFQYVLDPDGLMKALPRNSFSLVISAGVMEHIPAETAPQFVSNIASLLRPGGVGMHSIAIMDHLAFYDRSASPKQYLTFSESQWKFWCENKVQYINRIQRSDWLRMFDNAGFSLLEEIVSREDLPDLRVHPQYQSLSREDIECTNLVVAVRKRSPGDAPTSEKETKGYQSFSNQ
jgi:SAM-dependent methyltransferase